MMLLSPLISFDAISRAECNACVVACLCILLAGIVVVLLRERGVIRQGVGLPGASRRGAGSDLRSEGRR